MAKCRFQYESVRCNPATSLRHRLFGRVCVRTVPETKPKGQCTRGRTTRGIRETGVGACPELAEGVSPTGPSGRPRILRPSVSWAFGPATALDGSERACYYLLYAHARTYHAAWRPAHARSHVPKSLKPPFLPSICGPKAFRYLPKRPRPHIRKRAEWNTLKRFFAGRLLRPG